MHMVAPEEDVDELGHISNVAYVRWIQDVAVAHSVAVGFTTESYLTRGAVFVVRKHTVEYLQPTQAGDEIELRTHVASFRGAQCERHTHIVRKVDGALLVQAVTTWVFINLSRGRPTRIPVDLQQAFYTPVATTEGP